MRQQILNNLRNSLRRQELSADTRQTLETRLAAHTVHEQPAIGNDLIAKFFTQLEKAGGSKDTISHLTDLPFAVLEFLQQHHLPKHLVVDAHFKDIAWPPKFQIACRAAQDKDVSSVSWAFAGVAETGSLVLLSGPQSPTTLNFLPENHMVLLDQENLVAHLEEVWKKLRAHPMPRTVNFITGPSRTADIEQTLQKGAHGPKRLHVIFLKK